MFLLVLDLTMSEGLVLSGRFRLIEKIDSGGMGSVWRAEDLELEAEAAVKLIEPELLNTPEALERFQREAKAAAAIRSTHVVQVLGSGVQPIDGGPPRPYIAMELLKGETLARRLDRVSKLSAQEALPILTHVARALSVAHAAGIIHRDLKPENVFLVSEMGEDVAKVLDFGVAHHPRALSQPIGVQTPGVFSQPIGVQTQAGSVLGTPYYMSPEQTVGVGVNRRSDIWAFGVIAYECLIGVRPFDHDTLGGVFNAICVAEPPVPSKHGAVPAGFDAWFARATARDQAERFQTIEEALAALRVAFGHPGSWTPVPFVPATVPSPVRRASDTPATSVRTLFQVRRRRSWIVLAGGAFAAVSFAAVVRIGAPSGRAHEVPSIASGTGLPLDQHVSQPSSLGAASVVQPGTSEPAVVASALPLEPSASASHSANPPRSRKGTANSRGVKVLVSPTKKSQNVAGF